MTVPKPHSEQHGPCGEEHNERGDFVGREVHGGEWRMDGTGDGNLERDGEEGERDVMCTWVFSNVHRMPQRTPLRGRVPGFAKPGVPYPAPPSSQRVARFARRNALWGIAAWFARRASPA